MTELPASANKTISAEQIGPWMFSLLLTVILSEPHEIQKIKNWFEKNMDTDKF